MEKSKSLGKKTKKGRKRERERSLFTAPCYKNYPKQRCFHRSPEENQSPLRATKRKISNRFFALSLFLVYLRCNAFFFFLQTTTRTSMKRVYPNNGKRGSKEITPLVNYINRHRGQLDRMVKKRGVRSKETSWEEQKFSSQSRWKTFFFFFFFKLLPRLLFIPRFDLSLCQENCEASTWLF